MLDEQGPRHDSQHTPPPAVHFSSLQSSLRIVFCTKPPWTALLTNGFFSISRRSSWAPYPESEFDEFMWRRFGDQGSCVPQLQGTRVNPLHVLRFQTSTTKSIKQGFRRLSGFSAITTRALRCAHIEVLQDAKPKTEIKKQEYNIELQRQWNLGKIVRCTPSLRLQERIQWLQNTKQGAIQY